MKSEIFVEFLLTGFEISPEEITNAIGIEPTESWHIDDTIEKTKIKRKENGWTLSSGLDKSSELEEHLSALFEQLQVRWTIFTSLCSKYDSEISCAIYSYEAQGPSIHFDKEIVKYIAELNAEIDIDYYCLDNPKST
jgi:Domain of unknown function (DUF4279)